jgi:acyl dehydratase
MSCTLATAEIGETVGDRSFGPLGREDLRRYSEASGDGNPLHLDADFARQAGFGDVIVHGMLGMALLGRLVTECLPSYQLKFFRARFRHIIPVGQIINCTARLESRSDNAATLTLAASDGKGLIMIEGTAVVTALPGL